MLKSMFLAGMGGFVGTCLRFLVGRLCATYFPSFWPTGTMIDHMDGCLIIGILCGLAQRTNLISTELNVLLLAGFCGGFTTFSSFSNETFQMIQSRGVSTALLYVLLSVVLGIGFVWLGRWLTE